ncbi:MAG: polysaccharide pyruvyl transferase family protein [Saprospiraceae bacterium]|nr:polysaccharide pyruvyl transferase family protein [Saprospiraceae bacterium]
MNKKILICFTTLGNGGDLLLVKSVYQFIKDRFPQHTMTLTGYGYKNFISVNPDHNLPLYGEKFDDIHSKYSWIQYGIIKLKKWNILQILQQIFYYKQYRKLDKIWTDSDIVITCPGGYFHPYYDCNYKLRLLEKVIGEKKTCILLAQSFSELPLWPEKYKHLLLKVLTSASLVTLRETNQSIGVLKLSNTFLTYDMAFTYKNVISKTDYPARPRKICINFRKWKNISEIKEKIFLYLQYIAAQNCDIYYLSTCQGMSGYPDDAEFFKSLLSGFKGCTIKYIDGYHDTDELIKLYSTFDLVIGMRLHACIMALLTNTPAINITYESKGRKLFQNIGLEEFVLELEESPETWIQKTEYIMSAYPKALTKTRECVEKGKQLAYKNIELLSKFL